MTKFYIFGNIFSVNLLLINVIKDTEKEMIQKELKDLLERHQMTYPELAEKAGVPLETMRNLYYGKTKDPHVSTALAIARVFDITVNRLCGERYFTKQEQKMIRNFRQCGNHGKSLIMHISNLEADMAKYEKEAKNKHSVACITPLASVYDGLKYDSGKIKHIETDNLDAYLGVECTSNRFAPIYCKGDIVLLEDRYPNNGETAIFMKEDLIYCRQYIEHDNGYTLKSLNGKQCDFEFKRMDQMECIGTCIGVIRA